MGGRGGGAVCLTDLVDEHERVGRADRLEALDDLARHGAHVRPAVAWAARHRMRRGSASVTDQPDEAAELQEHGPLSLTLDLGHVVEASHREAVELTVQSPATQTSSTRFSTKPAPGGMWGCMWLLLLTWRWTCRCWSCPPRAVPRSTGSCPASSP